MSIGQSIAQNRVLTNLACLIGAAIGLLVLVLWAGPDYRQAIEARRAALTQVEGRLDRLEVRRIASSSGGGGYGYRVEVEYSYAYEGERYSGKRLGYGFNKWHAQVSQRKANEIAEGLEAQRPLTVYVDQRNPKRAVLFPDRDGIIGLPTLFITFIGGAFLLVCGGSLVVTTVQSLRSR